MPVSEAVEVDARVDEIIDKFIGRPGALIPILQSVQDLLGYLPEPALKHVAGKLTMPYSEVAGVVSFYSYFSTVPRGRHVVRVCMGTACYVRGGSEVLAAARKQLGVEVGGTTADGCFSLAIGRCFGACGLSPVVMVDDDVHQRVKPARLRELLEPYAARGEKP